MRNKIRPGLLGLVVGALVLGAGCVTSRKATFDKFVPPHQYRNGANPSQPKVQRHLYDLEKVPDQIQRIIAEEGGYVIFFNGPITDNPEAAHLKGKRVPGWKREVLIDNLASLHNSKSGAVLLGILCGDFQGRIGAALHEYGHSYDDKVGKRFFGKPLSKTIIVEDAIEQQPFRDPYLNRPREHVAESVNDYHGNSWEKKQLREKHPVMFNLLNYLERRAMKESK